MHSAEEDLKALCVALARVDELTFVRASLTGGTEQAKVEHETLAEQFCKLEAAQETRHVELHAVVRAM